MTARRTFTFPNLFACLTLALLSHQNCRAEPFPLWEAGAGLAALNFPDYRGSDERQSYVLPLPYFIYRGEFLKVEDGGVRGLFFKSDKAEVDISLNGSVPVDSEDNQARQGMPDLDPTVEIGPSLNFFLHRSSDSKVKLNLRLPLRAVIATDFSHVDHAGWIFQPNLNLDVQDVLGNPGWNFGASAGPIFSDKRYHEYIYGVAPAYATAERPAYEASNGYSGTQLMMTLSKRFRRFWVGGFVRWDNLSGSVADDSPLMKTKQYVAGGFAVSWVFSQSKIMVEAEK